MLRRLLSLYRKSQHDVSATLGEETLSTLKTKLSSNFDLGDVHYEKAEEKEGCLEGDRLLSWEFIFYWLVLAYATLVVLLAGLEVSWRLDDRRPGVISLHSKLGLLRYMHRSIDLSDQEWQLLRRLSLPLTVVLALFVVCSRLVARFWPRYRTAFYVAAGLAFTGYLHETRLALILAAIGANYLTADAVAGREFGVSVIWLQNLGGLLLSHQLPDMHVWRQGAVSQMLHSYPGQLGCRMAFPLVTLRMLSYSLDLHRMRSGRGGISGADIPMSNSMGDLKARLEQPLPWMCYSLSMYLAYVLYPPLYVCGPVLSYKSFASQLRSPKRTKLRQVLLYGGWVAAAGLLLELSCHLFYVHALAVTGVWLEMHQLAGFAIEGSGALSMAALSLGFVLLKYIVLWRFSRWWALLDGIGAPENVRQGLCSAFSLQEFWRNWDASLNRWLVRYLYVPLGGREAAARNALICFLFAAILVGPDGRMLAWAGCASAAFCLELAAKWAYWDLKLIDRLRPVWQRHIVAAAAGLNLAVLACLGLGGFVMGGSVIQLIGAVLRTPFHAAGCLLTLFAAAQILLELSDRKVRSRL